MPKDKLTDYSATNASNTDIGGIDIDEGMLPSAVNNALREQMTHLKNFSDGTDAIDALTVTGDLTVDTNTLHVDAANNRVGIGTVSPSVDLEIASTAGSIKLSDTDGSDKETIIKHSGGTFFVLARDGSSNAPLVFGGNGGGSFDEHLRIQSGGGISFNGDTAAANALDDYEEGVWAVAITPSSGSITLKSGSDRLGYIKIGNLVSVFGRVQINSVSSPSGNVLLSLPFGVASLEDEAATCHLQIGYYGVDVQANAYGAVAEAGANSSNATLLTLMDNSGWGAIQGGTFSANDFISINGVYQAN